jgi:hypothetical protein
MVAENFSEKSTVLPRVKTGKVLVLKKPAVNTPFYTHTHTNSLSLSLSLLCKTVLFLQYVNVNLKTWKIIVFQKYS